MRAAFEGVRLTIVLAFVLASMLSAHARAQTGDRPALLPIQEATYDFGDQAFEPDRFPGRVELRAEVVYPKGLPSGPYPLIVILHGRHSTCITEAPQPAQRRQLLTWPCPPNSRAINSFRGYHYLARYLASRGFIVVSVSANGISAVDSHTLDYGASARGQLIQKHLDFWNALGKQGADPFGRTFVGKVDLSRIGTMGHSRGGEGVIFHYQFNKRLNSPYTVRAIVPLAPMDQRRTIVSGVALAVVLPYCDGDLSDLQGVHYYDDARYALPGDAAPKYYFVMMGANHNYFNTVWSPSATLPGSLDDWSDGSPEQARDPYCGRSQTSKRLTEERQRQLGLAYIGMFFQQHVAGATQYAGILQGLTRPLSDQKPDDVIVSYQPPDRRANRFDLNRLQSSRNLTRNSAGGIVRIEQMDTAEMCGGDADRVMCLAGQPFSRQPHNTPGDLLLAPESRGLNQLRLGWRNGKGRFINELPPDRSDVSGYQWIQFRAALDYADPRNAGSSRDFSIRLVDSEGRSTSARLAQHSQALPYPPGKSNSLPKLVLATVRLPLDAFRAINLKQLKAVEFVFDASPSGAILLSDIAFSRHQ